MKLSDAEWVVMNAMWGAKGRPASPMTARDVLERIHGRTEWAYSTVKTLLARLAEKGAVGERKRANTSLFEARITRKQARREALRGLLDRAFDGAFGSLVQHMVREERLSKRDREALARMFVALDTQEESR